MNKIWTDEMDRRLLELRKKHGLRGAGRIMGISENAAIARYHRIQGYVFPYDLALARAAKERKKIRAEARRKKNAEVRAALVMAFRDGKSRLEAYQIAMQIGGSLELIGKYTGISRQAVHQYLRYYGVN